ncbi:hypothetical protein PybrP1_009962, partial [[Pythium] brassicae (nom. inval.)]
QCQICFDDIPQLDNVVTQLCGPKCPAVLCHGCLVGHLSVALQVGFVGALPRVRCPMCLVPLHKSQWSKHVRASTVTTDGKSFVLEEYARLCRVACSFQAPCCHNPDYVHLPKKYSASEPNPCMFKLPPSQIPDLQKKCRQFGRHRISPRDLVAYIEATFADESECVFEGVLARIMDEERQAALQLSYLALFDEAIDIVRCRGCRSLLVKVDGCDHVQCFELGQRHQLLEMFVSLWDQGRVNVQLKMLAKSHPGVRAGVAPVCVALPQFVWRPPHHAPKAEDERRRAERQLLVDADIACYKPVLAGFVTLAATQATVRLLA